MDMGLIITIAATGIGVVGSNIALIAWLRSDMKAFETKVDSWKDEIRLEIKDFHGRLERQDAEFKAHMMYLHGDKGSDKPKV
jgi:hypothetical protein